MSRMIKNEAMTFADNIIVMSDGEVVQAGTPKELFERPKHYICWIFYWLTCNEFIRNRSIIK